MTNHKPQRLVVGDTLNCSEVAHMALGLSTAMTQEWARPQLQDDVRSLSCMHLKHGMRILFALESLWVLQADEWKADNERPGMTRS